MYKKILLSSAIAVAMGTAGVAQAAVDLDKPNGENPLVFAEEIAIGTGVDLVVSAAGQNGGGDGTTAIATAAASETGSQGAVETAFGFTIGQGTSKYVRLTFDEPLGAALADSDFGSDNGDVTFSISQGGAQGDSYVIVEAAQPTGVADLPQTAHFIFAPDQTVTGKIVATSQSTRSIGFDLYETAVDAVNQSNALSSKSGQWITWGPGYEVSCTSADPSRIDVVNPEQFLDGTFSTNVANVTIDDLTVFTEAGVLVEAETNYFSAGSTVTIAGSTDAFEIANGFTLTGQDGAGALQATNPGAAPANGSASWTTVTNVGTPAPAGVAVPLVSGTFAVNADTTNEMVPSTYTLSIVDDGGATYDVGTVSTSCGELQYSGSTDRLDFALTPNGAFQQFARITNPSQTTGEVTVTVYNDEGSSVTFPLGDVAGVDSSLEARGSTKLININDIYAAAQAADATFALAATGPDSRNKLRVEVRGEFGDDAVEGENGGDRLVDRRADGIYIQGLTVSRDNNAFFQTK